MFSEVGLPKGHAPHFHPETIEFCYVLRGRLDWWIGDAIYEVHAGDVVVMPMGMPHGSIDSTLQPCEYYAVHLSPLDLAAPLDAAVNELAIEGLHASQSEAGQLVLRVFREHEQPDAYSEATCRALCSMLLVTLARDKRATAKRRVSNLVERAQSLLFTADDRGVSVAETARQLDVSTVWLNRRFRAEVGEAPGEWIRARRIAEAKKLLAFDGAPVTTVATTLGFKSSQYFANAFKRETGVSPSAYRTLARARPGSRFGDAVEAYV
jgi:AraC-like DNA-binding protein